MPLFADTAWYPYAVEILGLLGILASIVAFQCKSHGKVLFYRAMNEVFFGIQYILLGAYTGAMMDGIGCFRNYLFAKNVRRGKSNRTFVVAFSLLFTVLGLLTWDGAKSVLVIAAKVLSTAAYGNKNLFIVRTVILLTSSSWLAYNLLVGSYAGALCEVLTLGSLVLGIFRYDVLPRLKNNKKGDA